LPEPYPASSRTPIAHGCQKDASTQSPIRHGEARCTRFVGQEPIPELGIAVRIDRTARDYRAEICLATTVI